MSGWRLVGCRVRKRHPATLFFFDSLCGSLRVPVSPIAARGDLVVDLPSCSERERAPVTLLVLSSDGRRSSTWASIPVLQTGPSETASRTPVAGTNVLKQTYHTTGWEIIQEIIQETIQLQLEYCFTLYMQLHVHTRLYPSIISPLRTQCACSSYQHSSLHMYFAYTANSIISYMHKFGNQWRCSSHGSP